VETLTARYLLPPRQALWIPAGVEHSSTLTHVKAVSVFFDPAMDVPAGDRVRILAAAPVLREMIRYARRWPINRTAPDPVAEAFFDALALLVVEWLDDETPLCLPTTGDPVVAAAMQYTDTHLADVTLRDVCAAVGTSERSLRRAFVNATGMSWRQYLQESRLLKAMALLAEGDHSTLTIALSVGFDSVSAFTRAFHRYAGETPRSYRRRTRAVAAADEWDEEQARCAVQAWSHWDEEPSTAG
jgi:AraC-like DNA-binding protein